ncbi:hypothetical protein H632_c3783p0, partial [Helicosporidium sp. ATCC 50920]
LNSAVRRADRHVAKSSSALRAAECAAGHRGRPQGDENGEGSVNQGAADSGVVVDQACDAVVFAKGAPAKGARGDAARASRDDARVA